MSYTATATTMARIEREFATLPHTDRSALLLRLSQQHVATLSAAIDAALMVPKAPKLHTIRKSDSTAVQEAKRADNKQIKADYFAGKLK